MSLNIVKKMALGYGVLLALLVALGIVFMTNLSGVIKQFNFVIEHGVPVIANARELSKLVIDMETGQRGFVITGKEEFLEPYNEGVSKFEKLIEKEKELASDNPSQVKALEKIEGLIDQWQQKAARPEIAIGKEIAKNLIDAEYLQTLLANGVGKGIMDNIRSVFDEMIVNFRRSGNEDALFLSISIAKDLVDMETGQRGFVITGKDEFLEPYLAGQKRSKEHISKLRSLLSNDERSLTALAKVESLANDWFEKAATPEINARREMNKNPETLKDMAALLEAGTGKKILDQIREEFKKFIKIEEGLTKNRYLDATSTASRTRSLIVIFVIVSIIFGGAVAFFISRSITSPVQKLKDAVALVARGDLTTEIRIQTKDEIGQLASAFDQMVKDLRHSDEVLRESEERYKAIFDRSLDAIYLNDFEGNFIDANPAALNLLGYTKEDISSLNFVSLLDQDQINLALKTMEGIIDTGFQASTAEF